MSVHNAPVVVALIWAGACFMTPVAVALWWEARESRRRCQTLSFARDPGWRDAYRRLQADEGAATLAGIMAWLFWLMAIGMVYL